MHGWHDIAWYAQEYYSSRQVATWLPQWCLLLLVASGGCDSLAKQWSWLLWQDDSCLQLYVFIHTIYYVSLADPPHYSHLLTLKTRIKTYDTIWHFLHNHSIRLPSKKEKHVYQLFTTPALHSSREHYSTIWIYWNNTHTTSGLLH